MTATVLHAERVGRVLGKRPVLDGVTVTAHGGVTVLLGPNGAGKTTLLRCLATVQQPDSGSLRVDGLDPAIPLEREAIRARLGYLPQEPGFASGATIFDALDYLAVLKKIGDRRARRREVHRVLVSVELADQLGVKVGTLSVGMRRRLGIAASLLGAPSLLILDEPTAGLDPEQRLQLRSLLSRIGSDRTVVVSTHLVDEAAAMATTVVVLVAGRILFAGAPDALRTTAHGRVWTSPTSPMDPDQLSWRLADGTFRGIGPMPADGTPAEPTLEDAYLLLSRR